MTSRKLAFTALALALPLAFACGTEPDVGDIQGTDAELACFTKTETPPTETYDWNVTCKFLGYDFDAKVDFPTKSPTTIKLFGGDEIVFVHDGYYVNWTSTLGIDAVIVKGGPGANVWVYDPEAFADNGLYSPDNPGGNLPEISHVDFCFDYEVEVEKTATPTFERQFFWDIQKTGSETALTLSPTQTYQVVYDVTVSNTGFVDYGWAVGGTITVTNPAPIAAKVTSVSDLFGGEPIPVVCDAELPAILEPLGTLTCTYGLTLDGVVNGENLAIVTTEGLVGGGEATAAVTFGEPTELVDECLATVTDSLQGVLGTNVCANETFTYTRELGPFEVCGEQFLVENVAEFVTNDTGTTGSDDHLVVVTIPPCPVGCTLTQGYWKTHSKYGPAPYDEVWAELGEDTPFYLSGMTYHKVLWTPPKGNAYFLLAHQYIAAKLNALAGAATTDVAQTLTSAEKLFITCTPSMVTKKSTTCGSATFTSLAGTLDQYNNGLIGPGHCDEQADPVPR